MSDTANPLLRASPDQTAEACACALATITKSLDMITLAATTSIDGSLVINSKWRAIHLEGLAGLASCVEAALHGLAEQLEDLEVGHG